MRTLAMLAVVLIAGCDPDATVRDAGAPSPDAATSPPDAGPACEPALEGDEPFALELTGSFTLRHDLDSSMTEAADEVIHVWFPEGRRPGGPVWFSHPVSWPYPTVTSAVDFISPSGDVGRFGLRGSYSFEEFHVDGRLASWPEGGVELEAWRNVAFDGTDVVEGASGFVRLCPTTEAPRPRLTVVRQPVTPLSTILVVASAPWQTAPSLELWSDGAPVDAIVEDRGGDYPSLGGYSRVFIMAIRPVALFPFGRALELRVDGADVMGRPYELSSDGTFVIAVPSEVVGDLSLDSWPPEGSYAGVRPARAPTAGWLAARSGGCIISR